MAWVVVSLVATVRPAVAAVAAVGPVADGPVADGPRVTSTRMIRPAVDEQAPFGKRPSPSAAPIRVAVGLSPETAGSKAEVEIVDRLELSMGRASRPADLRRLRAGSSGARSICREGRDDLVVLLGYLPDRESPVFLAHDCVLDRALGIRGARAANQVGFLGVLWEEHQTLLSEGIKPSRRVRLPVRVRTALIVGAAATVLGVAVGILVGSALRKDTVVLTVQP